MNPPDETPSQHLTKLLSDHLERIESCLRDSSRELAKLTESHAEAELERARAKAKLQMLRYMDDNASEASVRAALETVVGWREKHDSASHAAQRLASMRASDDSGESSR